MHYRILLAVIVLSLSVSNGSALLAQPITANSAFPAAGHQYELKFSDRQFHVDYARDGKQMNFTRPDGSGDTAQYTAIEIRPNVFMVYWTGAKARYTRNSSDRLRTRNNLRDCRIQGRAFC